jgi:HD-GYP domain-containing protein (c-di-GMP phosphodiesterase class II)
MVVLDYVPVKLKELPNGLVLKSGLYSLKSGETGGEYSLLCENQIVTQTLINRLKRAVFPDTKVYIDRRYVITLFDKGYSLGFKEEIIKAIRNDESPWKKERALPPMGAARADSPNKLNPAFNPASNAKFFREKFKPRKFAEVVKHYDETKVVTEGMLSEVAETGKVDTEQGKAITSDIQDQLNNTDVSLIVQAINRIRSADEYLHTHCLNVAYLNGLMGRWLNFDKVRQNEVVETGLFHDIGKLKLSPEILHKADKLTEEETIEMQRHPVLSLEILMKSGVRNKAVLEGVLQHHERVNGTGYPKGLRAKAIGEYARITAISDTYDAMVTQRIHSDSHSPFVILHEFEQGGYSELDLKYINVFIECMVEELKGKEIIMNDGREAVVMLVSPRQLLYPIVEIDGTVVMTNERLYCVRMKNVSN